MPNIAETVKKQTDRILRQKALNGTDRIEVSGIATGTGAPAPTVNSPAADLTAHKASGDHDGRYYTEGEIDGKLNFATLTDTPAAYTGEGGKIVAVKSDVTGLEFVAAPPAENGVPPGGTTNQLAAKNSNDDYDIKWVDAPEAANGIPAGGTVGQILEKVDGTDFNTQWATPSAEAIPICHVYHDAQQSIASNTDTVLAFNSERFDTDSIHDNSANNSRLTCKTAGKYLISGHAEFTQHATGLRTLWILLNGTTILAMQKVPGTSISKNNTTISIQTMWDLEVNDYVELWVRQASGTSLNVLAVNSSPQFMMVKVG